MAQSLVLLAYFINFEIQCNSIHRMSSRNSNLSDTRHYSTLLTWQSPVIFKMLSQICTQFDEIWALNKTWTNLFFPPNQVSKSWVDNHSRDIAILDDSAILWNPFLGSVLSNALESRCLITGQTCTIPATEYAILITGEFSSTPSATMSHRIHIREIEYKTREDHAKKRILLYTLRCLRKEYVRLRDFEGGQEVSLAGSTVPLSKIWCIW